jgi:hypothetical protein
MVRFSISKSEQLRRQGFLKSSLKHLMRKMGAVSMTRLRQSSDLGWQCKKSVFYLMRLRRANIRGIILSVQDHSVDTLFISCIALLPPATNMKSTAFVSLSFSLSILSFLISQSLPINGLLAALGKSPMIGLDITVLSTVLATFEADLALP